jgi:hypothetical protein
VACEPTIQISLFLLVARDAEAHFELRILEAIQGLYLTVTLFAKDLLLDVPFMVEKHVLRQIVHFDPGRRCLGIEIPVLLLDLRVIGDDVFVAVKAFFHRRDSWKAGAVHIGMTEFTLNLLHPCVDSVAEGDRLLRPKAFDRHEVEMIEPGQNESQTAEGHQDGQLISQQCIQPVSYFTSCL